MIKTREEYMEMMDTVLVEMMEEYDCDGWWEIIDSDLIDELEERIAPIFGRDACDVEAYHNWISEMVEDL